MAQAWHAAAAFAAGCLLQLVYLTWGKWTRKHVVGLVVVGPLGWLLATAEIEDPLVAAFSATLGITAGLAISFRANIIPSAGEHTLLLATLPLWALVAEADWTATGIQVLAAVLAASTVLVLLLVAAPWHPPRGIRVSATILAILQLVALVGWQFRLHSLAFFFGGDPPSPLQALASGLLFAFAVAHLMQVYAILRPPETETAPRDSSQARREHLDLLAQRFQTTHLGVSRATFMALLFAAYWGMGRTLLHLEPLLLLWPWLVLAPRLFVPPQPAPGPATA